MTMLVGVGVGGTVVVGEIVGVGVCVDMEVGIGVRVAVGVVVIVGAGVGTTEGLVVEGVNVVSDGLEVEVIEDFVGEGDCGFNIAG